MRICLKSAFIVLCLVWVSSDYGFAQSPNAIRSAPVSDVGYRVIFDRSTAALRQIEVSMRFRTAGTDPVILSLPAWTPGSYELDNYARNVTGFAATAGERPLRWDKVDYDSWRIFPDGARQVTVHMTYRADNLDTGSSWTAADFAFFNGTNLYLYAEGQGYGFPATVEFETEADWLVATGMDVDPETGDYVAADYHELVDMPTLVGRFDLDSTMIDGVLHRLATYPAGMLEGERREAAWDELRGMLPPMASVFNDTPFETYTTLMVFAQDFGGLSALEHRNSHLGIYTPLVIGSPILASVVAHEIFHAWNVKRLRPAELVPYDYGRPQPTTLLWVSEGITSYYDDLALVRGGLHDREHFYDSTAGDIDRTENAGAVALEDASLSSWIGPRDGTGGVYYQKGAAAGFLLDILIRDASENRASLDDVMRELYERTYAERFTGFTEADWWETVSRTAGGESFRDFYARYVDGREPYPWREVLSLAGLELREDTTVRPQVGIFPVEDSLGVRIAGLVPDGAAAAGGVQEGDYLVRAGPVEIENSGSFDAFRAHFAEVPEGTPYEVVVRRGGELVTLELELRLARDVNRSLLEDADAPARAVRIREAILGVQRGDGR